MNNYTELIDQYLNNEMSAAEKLEFEAALKHNKALQTELEIQNNLMQSFSKLGLKQELSRAFSKQKRIRNLIKAGTIVLSVAILAGISYYVVKSVFEPKTKEKTEIQSFKIQTDKDTIIETEGGIVFAIPAGAFDTEEKEVDIEIKEALIASDIMRMGLSTTSDGELLSTAGMFSLEGKSGGKKLGLKKAVDASVPAEEINPKMQLFDGVVDAKGNINWVNPKKIVRNLKTYDLSELDFYPENYLPTLAALKLNSTDRRFTDSLYYSFSGFGIATIDDAYEKKKEIRTDTIAKSSPARDYFIRDRYSADAAETVSPTNSTYYEIDPSRIRAIKSEQFKNTFIATKEFEKRMVFMHSTCTAKYLEVYLQNLTKPLYYSDSLCAAMASGEVKQKFLDFYKLKEGGVEASEGLQRKLSHYFAKKYKAFKVASEKTWQKFAEEREAKQLAADKKRMDYQEIESMRNVKVFEEEYCLNVVDAYRQLGVKAECPVRFRAPAPHYYNISVTTTGWKNLDQYVYEATLNRSSMRYVEPDGREANITYSPIQITLTNATEFDNTVVYLVPDKLNSFQKTNQNGNLFTEKLNGLLQYKIVALGFKNKKPFYAEIDNARPQKYSLTLNSISEKDLDLKFKGLGKLKIKDFALELGYQKFEAEERVRILKLNEQWNQLETIAKAVFKCYQSGEKLPDLPK